MRCSDHVILLLTLPMQFKYRNLVTGEGVMLEHFAFQYLVNRWLHQSNTLDLNSAFQWPGDSPGIEDFDHVGAVHHVLELDVLKAFGRRASRCDDIDNLLEKGCPEKNIIAPYSVPEILETCEARCSELRYCVHCQAFETSKECENCELNLEIVDNFGDILPNEKNCTFKDAEDCSFTFVYAYDDNNRLVIQVLKTRECQSSMPILWIVVGALAGVILVVLIVYLILRFYLHRQDVKRFKEFERIWRRT